MKDLNKSRGFEMHWVGLVDDNKKFRILPKFCWDACLGIFFCSFYYIYQNCAILLTFTVCTFWTLKKYFWFDLIILLQTSESVSHKGPYRTTVRISRRVDNKLLYQIHTMTQSLSQLCWLSTGLHYNVILESKCL